MNTRNKCEANVQIVHLYCDKCICLRFIIDHKHTNERCELWKISLESIRFRNVCGDTISNFHSKCYLLWHIDIIACDFSLSPPERTIQLHFPMKCLQAILAQAQWNDTRSHCWQQTLLLTPFEIISFNFIKWHVKWVNRMLLLVTMGANQ